MSKDNSKPAFPMPYSTDQHDQPCNTTFAYYGLTKREIFATAALQGLLAGGLNAFDSQYDMPPYIADRCFMIADAMIAESEK